MTIIRTYYFRGHRFEIFELPGDGATAATGLSAGIHAPGAGQITIHSLQAALGRRASGVRLAISGVVEGGPIASVTVELLLYDVAQKQAYGPVHTRNLDASSYREMAGVRLPVWKTPLKVQASLAVGLRLLSDGKHSSLARLTHVQPGATGPHLALQADGEYIAGRDYNQALQAQAARPDYNLALLRGRRARAIFGPDRRLKELRVYTQVGAAQTPRAVQPTPGDRFVPYVRVFELGRDGSETVPDQAGSQPQIYPEGPGREAAGNALVFGAAGLHWYSAPMMPGEYLAGLAVTDLDGQVQRAFTAASLG